MTDQSDPSSQSDQKTTDSKFEQSSSIKGKIRENLPTIAKIAAIAGVAVVVYTGIGIDQNPFTHELTHDLRHALGYACH